MLAIVITLSLVTMFCHIHGNKPKAKQVLSVHAAVASVRPMPVIIEVPGIIEAETTVSILLQVAGIIKRIAVEPWDNIETNQLF